MRCIMYRKGKCHSLWRSFDTEEDSVMVTVVLISRDLALGLVAIWPDQFGLEVGGGTTLENFT